MVVCKLVCKFLMQSLTEKQTKIFLHSAFQNAVNLVTPIGMVTLLSPEKGLQPYSAVLSRSFSFEQLKDSALYISRSGIRKDEKLLLSFEGAEQKNTYLNHKPRWSPEAKRYLLDFLREYRGLGLTGMAFGEYSDIYSEFLAPRLETLRNAVRKGQETSLILAAERFAGCGMGLTPSSDDFLCGYLLGMPEPGVPGITGKMACAAAARTNDISASLLRRAGEGFFSCDILHLAECLERETSSEELRMALERVAAFGSSSGCDFLTGLYFGITDSFIYYENGGIKK